MHALSRIGSSLFDDIFSATTGTPTIGGLAITPAVNIIDTPEELVVEVEVPGVPPDAINLTVSGDMLTVSGEKSKELRRTDQTGRTTYSERSYGHFSRSIRLPRGADSNKISAKAENGILTISVGKADPPRRIEIKPNSN